MVNEKEKLACKFQAQQLELVCRWHNELESGNRNIAFELLNQVIDGKITNNAAFTLLESK